MIDRNVITDRLALIRKYTGYLEEIATVSYDDFAAKWETHLAAEHALQICIQATADTCNYLVTFLKEPMPEGPAGLPQVVAARGVLPKELASRLSSMIGMRSILVHGYAKVDLELVYKTICMNLGDFDDFARYIVAYLEKETEI
jgi:uncharacterized protein YutE (UPF0331/DUF86 family)